MYVFGFDIVPKNITYFTAPHWHICCVGAIMARLCYMQNQPLNLCTAGIIKYYFFFALIVVLRGFSWTLMGGISWPWEG